MITLSFDFGKGAKHANRGTHEQEIRDIVDTHLAFPGSEKLRMGVNVKSNGATSVSFTGPQEAIAEARRLWRENVQPAVAKVKRAATKLRRSAARAAQPAKRKPTKKIVAKKTAAKKATPKPAKKVAKRAAVRVKAKTKTSRKRK